MDIKEIKFLLTHSSIYGLGTIVSQAVAFIMLPIYTRYLTPQDYGILELIDITNMLAGIVVTIGIARGMSRFFYEEENTEYRNRVISTVYITYTGVSLIALPVLVFLSPYFSQLILSSDNYSSYFIISFISLFLGGLVDIGLMYLRLIKKPVFFISITLSRLVILLTLNIVFIVFLKLGILGILYSTLIARILFALLLSSSILHKCKFGFSTFLFREIMKFSLPLIPANFASSMIKQSDKYFIRYFLSIADTGIYSLALKLGNSLHLLITMPFIMTYVPRRFEIMKKEDAKSTFKQVYTYYSFIFIFLGLCLSVLVPEVLKIMTTEKYYTAGKYIPLVILSMFLFGSQYHFDFGILYSKKTKYFAYINFIIAVLHLGLNFLMINKYGMWGAIWASIIVLGAQAFLYCIVSSRLFKINYEFFRISVVLLLAVLFYFISLFLSTSNMLTDIIFKMFLLFIYPVLLVFLRMLTREEKEMILKIVRKIYSIMFHVKRPV